MTGIKGHIKMTSESKKEIDSNQKDRMKEVWRNYAEAQQAWKDMVNYNKNTNQTDIPESVDDKKK